MTGVGGRPELIIEGANSEDGPWKVCFFTKHKHMYIHVYTRTHIY